MVTFEATVDEALIKKIKALLRKGDVKNGATPEEAAAFAAKAQELMFKYNLSTDTIQSANDDERKPSDDYGMHLFKPDKIGMYIWWRDLMTGIINANFCYQLFQTRNGKYVASTIIGQPHNVEFSKYLYEYLRGEIYRMAQQAWEEKKRKCAERFEPLPHSWGFHSSFCRGAVSMVVDRLREQKRASQRESESTMALVVRKDKEMEEALHRLVPHIFGPKVSYFQDKTPRGVRQREAYNNGREAARNIPLTRPIERDGSKSNDGRKLLS